MRNMKKRVSFLLALVMLFALLAVPANAVAVEGDKAIVTEAEIDDAIAAADSKTVVVDFRGVNELVMNVQIPAVSMKKIAETGKTLTVTTGFATLEVNRAALTGIANQVGNDGEVVLGIQLMPVLNPAQMAVLKDIKIWFNTNITYGEKQLEIGEGGYMVAILPEEVVGDMADQYVVAHLDENGELDVVETDYLEGNLLAKLDQLAIYVLMDKPAEDFVNPFEDVAESDWFYAPVMWAVNAGVTGGKTENTFAPNENCTRAQVVTFLYAAAGKPEVKAESNPFVDVSESDWFYAPVMWAVENGITGGKTADTFAPNDTCTRAQVVTFLYAAAGKPAVNGAGNPFEDVADSDWFVNPVLWAVDKGVTGGKTENTFAPNENCTRAQVVTFLYANEGKPAIK